MPLALQRRQVGEINVLTCSGTIAEGAPSLQQVLDSLIPGQPYIVINLDQVEFIDSGGLGLLVRMLGKARAAGGDIKLGRVPARIEKVLRITRLRSVFDLHESEEAAVTAFYHEASANAPDRFDSDILCINPSPDVLAYTCGVLRQSGYAVMASANLTDALILLKAARPKAVVIDIGLRTEPNRASSTAFDEAVATVPVVELPADFSSRDAGEAGQRLLDQVRTIIGG